MAERIKAILFDMDGTVLDSEGIFSDAQIELLKEYNINQYWKTYCKYYYCV